MDESSQGYKVPEGAGNIFQLSLPLSILLYTSLNIAGITYLCSTSCISAREGHISRRKTSLPSALRPAE